MTFLIFLLLAPVSLTAVLAALMVVLRSSRAASDPRRWLPAIFVAAWLLALIVYSLDVLSDPSSTAAVALYFAPAVGLFAGLLVFATAASTVALARGAGAGSGLLLASRRTEAAIAAGVLLSVAALVFVAGSDVQAMRRAADESASPPLLHELYADAINTGDSWALAALAQNSATPPDLLAEMAHGRSSALAEQPQILGTVAYGHSAWWHLARRRDVPQSALARLAEVDSVPVLSQLAQNPEASPDLLRRLASKQLIEVLRVLAFNSNTPEDVLRDLAEHPDTWIQRRLAARDDVPRP